MEFRTGTGVSHKIWLKSHVCLTLGNHRNIFFNCNEKYFQDLPHFLSVMSEIKMSWVCTVEDTQLMVVKEETSEKLKASHCVPQSVCKT